MTTILVMAGIVSIGLFGLIDNDAHATHIRNATTQCEANCNTPTLGINENGDLYVENGFSYNGNPVDVDSFFTPYPLITAEVGKENVARFKVYEDTGTENVSHFALAFGIGQGKIFSDSKAIIEWDKAWNGQETLNVIDPENSLDNVKVVTSTGSCKKGVIFGSDCLLIYIYHTFRQPLDFNIVGTYYWDAKRNAANNYFNDGIEIIGDSLNPPAEYQGIHNGKLITITETGKNTAIDEDGNTWTLDGSWNKDYIVKGKIIDGVSMHGIDRDHVFFQTYIDGQKLLAQDKLISMLDGKSEFYSENQQRIIDEKLRDQQMFDQLVKDSFIFK